MAVLPRVGEVEVAFRVIGRVAVTASTSAVTHRERLCIIYDAL